MAADNAGRQCARCDRGSRDKLIAPPEVPAEFWQTGQLREAFAAQHMGQVARAYRTHPYHYAVYGPGGIPQQLLGQWLGLRQPQVSRYETGPPIRDLDTLTYWARVLAIPAKLLWFDPPGERRQFVGVEPANSHSAATPRENAPVSPTLRWATSIDAIRQSVVALSGYTLEDAQPAGAVDTLAISTLALRWLVVPKDGAVFRSTGWPRIGFGDVNRLGVVRRQLKALDDAHGGGTAFPMAVTYLRREVVPLLRDGQYDDSTGRALFAGTAELELDLGWMAYDAGNCALAWRYMTQALRLSHATDDRLFGGRVLAAMSHQALHLRQVSLAVDLAQAARVSTKRIAPPRAQAMLAAMEACAQAADRQAAPCAAALVAAENAWARVRSDDDPSWLDFDRGGLSGHTARALRDLRQYREAESYAVASLALCRDGHCRTRARRNAILAMTQLQLGYAEAAAATGLLIVGDARNLRSDHVQSDLAALVRALESTDAPAAGDFLEQARELLTARSGKVPSGPYR